MQPFSSSQLSGMASRLRSSSGTSPQQAQPVRSQPYPQQHSRQSADFSRDTASIFVAEVVSQAGRSMQKRVNAGSQTPSHAAMPVNPPETKPREYSGLDERPLVAANLLSAAEIAVEIKQIVKNRDPVSLNKIPDLIKMLERVDPKHREPDITFQLSEWYKMGIRDVLIPNRNKAYFYSMLAANQGGFYAQLILGIAHSDVRYRDDRCHYGDEVDTEQADYYFKQAGDAIGCKVDQNPAYALYLLGVTDIEAVCREEIEAKKFTVLYNLAPDGYTSLIQLGIRRLQRAADANCSVAHAQLGLEYACGFRVPSDLSRAKTYCLTALASVDDPFTSREMRRALLSLSLIYVIEGQPHTLEQGVRNLVRLARENDGHASLNLALVCKFGRGVEKNPKLSNDYFMAARRILNLCEEVINHEAVYFPVIQHCGKSMLQPVRWEKMESLNS